MEHIKALQIIKKGLKIKRMQQRQLSRIQTCASASGSVVMDNLQLLMKNLGVPFNFKLTNSGLLS